MKIIIYQNREVYKEESKIGNDSENKVETLEFEFPEEYKDFTKYIEFQTKDEKYVDLIEDDKYIITRAIAKYGKIKAQIVLRNSLENDVAVFKSDIFELKVSKSINATIDVPIEYPTWIDNLTRLKQDIEHAEHERVSNENERISAEKTRQENFTKMQETVSSAVSNIKDLTDKYNENDKQKTEAFNKNFEEKQKAINDNAEAKTTAFGENAEAQTKTFNTNSDDKLAEYNKNHTAKMKEFDDNYDTKTKTFDDNASAKLDEYNKNTELKEKSFNDNAGTKTETFNTNAADKQNEFDENASDKLAEYNQNAKELINKVEQVQAENETLKAENKLIKEQIPSASASGNSIHVEDSGTLDFDWKIRGGHKQETREGYNLLDFNVAQDSRVTVNEDGTLTINGTGGFVLNIDKLQLKAGITYYQKVELISGSISGSNINTTFLSFAAAFFLMQDLLQFDHHLLLLCYNLLLLNYVLINLLSFVHHQQLELFFSHTHNYLPCFIYLRIIVLFISQILTSYKFFSRISIIFPIVMIMLLIFLVFHIHKLTHLAYMLYKVRGLVHHS